MRKLYFMLLAMLMLFLSGCSTPLHTNVKGAKISIADVEAVPMEVGIKVGEKISGVCETTSFLIFRLKSPKKLAYGVDFDEKTANYGGDCTEGAVYTALNSSNSDIIVAPRFITEGNTFLCLPIINACVYRDVKVTVTGYKGTYEEFKKIDPDLRKIKSFSEKTTSASLTPSYFGFFNDLTQ